MEDDKKCTKCDMPMKDGEECKCEEGVCCKCCNCEDDCTCGCEDKKETEEEK